MTMDHPVAILTLNYRDSALGRQKGVLEEGKWYWKFP
jgi:hypothetical protein